MAITLTIASLLVLQYAQGQRYERATFVRASLEDEGGALRVARVWTAGQPVLCAARCLATPDCTGFGVRTADTTCWTFARAVASGNVTDIPQLDTFFRLTNESVGTIGTNRMVAISDVNVATPTKGDDVTTPTTSQRTTTTTLLTTTSTKVTNSCSPNPCSKSNSGWYCVDTQGLNPTQPYLCLYCSSVTIAGSQANDTCAKLSTRVRLMTYRTADQWKKGAVASLSSLCSANTSYYWVNGSSAVGTRRQRRLAAMTSLREKRDDDGSSAEDSSSDEDDSGLQPTPNCTAFYTKDGSSYGSKSQVSCSMRYQYLCEEY